MTSGSAVSGAASATGDADDHRIGAAVQFHGLRKRQGPRFDGIEDLEGADVQRDGFGNVRGEAGDLDLADQELQDAAHLGPRGGALDDDGDLQVHRLVHVDAQEIEVEDLVGEAVHLVVMHQRGFGGVAAGHLQVENGVLVHVQAQQFGHIVPGNGDGDRRAVAAVDDGGDAAGVAQFAVGDFPRAFADFDGKGDFFVHGILLDE